MGVESHLQLVPHDGYLLQISTQVSAGASKTQFKIFKTQTELQWNFSEVKNFSNGFNDGLRLHINVLIEHFKVERFSLEVYC